MAVWNWYMSRAVRERVAIIAAAVIVAVLVIGVISSLTDEDGDDEDVELADDDPPYSFDGPNTTTSTQSEGATTTE